MQVIAFVTQKGGSGKSTLAINCAVAAHMSKKRVLILDLDPQQTAAAWYQDRDADAPLLASVKSVELPDAIKKAKDAGMDFVLIDTPGRDEPIAAAAIRAADFCVIPCRPTPADMKALPPTMATVTRLEKKAAFVLTQTPARGQRHSEAGRALSIYSLLGMVCPHNIVARNAYQDAQGLGLGVTEYEPEGKAATDIRALWQWIVRQLNYMTGRISSYDDANATLTLSVEKRL
jgi:chromosome partitioning protein